MSDGVLVQTEGEKDERCVNECLGFVQECVCNAIIRALAGPL